MAVAGVARFVSASCSCMGRCAHSAWSKVIGDAPDLVALAGVFRAVGQGGRRRDAEGGLVAVGGHGAGGFWPARQSQRRRLAWRRGEKFQA